MTTLGQTGITVEVGHHEVAAAGQNEIGIRFSTLTKMADDLLWFKYCVKNVAKQNGKSATFMPKPIYGDNGSGMHVHQSIWKAGKPLFIDKPVAGSLADAIVIYETAKKHNVPVFSSSSYRFYPGIVELKKSPELGKLTGASVWGPCSYQEGTPDMFFYGIHGIEALYTLMGTGCESVSRVQAADADQVTGVWSGGRVGTYRGIRKGSAKSGAVAYGTNGVVTSTKTGSYEDLCREIAKFFKMGKPPVSAEETIEIFTFMEAADQSKLKSGASVVLADVLAKAKAEAALKMNK